ncbi:hypothetical protein EDB89DRAFT_1911527 [Lactarius sanguifluus]|nr:hypothetical protein EDB89DRAFT_1911527 [Lactarius sanguifluus]
MPTVAAPAIITTPTIVAVAVAIAFSSSESLLTLSTSPSCPCGRHCVAAVLCSAMAASLSFGVATPSPLSSSSPLLWSLLWWSWAPHPSAWLNRPRHLAILAGAVGVKVGVVGMPPASQSDLRWWDTGGGWKLVRLAAFSRMWPPVHWDVFALSRFTPRAACANRCKGGASYGGPNHNGGATTATKAITTTTDSKMVTTTTTTAANCLNWKKLQPDRTTTENNRTFGRGWGPAQKCAVGSLRVLWQLMSPCRGVVIAVAAVATIVVVGATALAGLVAVGSACSGAASGRTTNNDDIININDFADPSRSSCQPVPPPPHHWHRKSDCVAWAAKARCEAHRLQLDNGDSEAKTEATANNNHDDDDDDDGRGQQLGCNRRNTTGHGSNDDDHPNNNYDTADRGSNDDDTDGGGGDAAGFCYTTRDCWYGAPVLLQLQLQNSGWRTNRSRSGCCQIGQKTGLNWTFKL